MKKNQTKGQFKEMKGKAKDAAGYAVRIHEPGHEEKTPNAHVTIEAAFASLKREYKKA